MMDRSIVVSGIACAVFGLSISVWAAVEAPSGGDQAGILSRTNTWTSVLRWRWRTIIGGRHRLLPWPSPRRNTVRPLSGYWPQIGLKGGYKRTDEPPNFVFPASQMGIPAQSIAVPAQSISIPAGTANITVPAQIFGDPTRERRSHCR